MNHGVRSSFSVEKIFDCCGQLFFQSCGELLIVSMTLVKILTRIVKLLVVKSKNLKVFGQNESSNFLDDLCWYKIL